MTVMPPPARHRLLLCLCLVGSAAGTVLAQEPQILHKEPLPSIQPVVIAEPVAVPETIGATMLAGLGFLLMFRRRRYS